MTHHRNAISVVTQQGNSVRQATQTRKKTLAEALSPGRGTAKHHKKLSRQEIALALDRKEKYARIKAK